MIRTGIFLVPLAAMVFYLAGCASMAPKCTQPAAPVPTAWPSGAAYQEGATETGKAVAEIPWKEFFVDPQLPQLIALALDHNRDLRVAALNIERARAQYRIQRAELYPYVAASGDYSKQRVAPDVSGLGQAQTLELYSAQLGVSSWEADFFGRVRSLEEQALEEYFATEEARRSAQISLIAEVAGAYLRLAADRELLELARQTLASYQETYELTRRRFEVGVSSALDLRQAQTSVDGTRVDIARYTGLVAEDENALRLLLGTSVPAELLPETLESVTDLKDIPAGVPSAVLQRRPDILAAEHQMKGANANIGAARAAFFPRISLTAAGGFASEELSDLFSSSSRAWSFAPRLDLPIFTAGSLRARLKTSEVDREIALARYEGAIQGAFREVADALAVRGTIEEQLTAQRSLVDATAESYRLSEARFSKGIDSFLNVLDSQRSYYGAQQNLIGIRLTRLTNLVTLYRVLGGGAA